MEAGRESKKQADTNSGIRRKGLKNGADSAENNPMRWLPSFPTSLWPLLILIASPATAATYTEKPQFEDFRRVGEVLQGYSQHKENNTYGVTLRVSGQSVRTLAEGRVYSAGKLRGYGRFVIIDHGQGWHSLYSNLARVDVRTGQQVLRWGAIGTARHKRLFLVVSYRGNPINPSDILGGPVHAKHAAPVPPALVGFAKV